MKTILVTGADEGLGLAIASRLASHGHRMTLTTLDPRAGAHAVAEIRREHASVSVEHRQLDLSSFASVRAFVADLPPSRTFEVLICLATECPTLPRSLSVDGYERSLAMNALGPFLLTYELQHRLGDPGHAGRVIVVAPADRSAGRRGEAGGFDFDDPNLDQSYTRLGASDRSRLATMWFTQELARRASTERLTVNAVDSGCEARSDEPVDFWLRTSGSLRSLFGMISRERDAADAVSYLAEDSAVAGTTGTLWKKKTPVDVLGPARDTQQADQFWHWCERVTKVGLWSTVHRFGAHGG
jgi:NAD(P)-dependent dehydrogenase (short-subunit alcohol dehydrogenase family)